MRNRIDRVKRTRLATECARLDPDAERALAEDGIAMEASEWPEYYGVRSAGATWSQRVAMNNPTAARCSSSATMFLMKGLGQLLLWH